MPLAPRICRPWNLPSEPRAQLAVVMDVVRATTTAAVLCERTEKLIVLASPEGLTSFATQEGYTVFSELEIEPRWTHLDNSPALAHGSEWSGQPILISTNGTPAVHAALDRADEVVLAAFVNLTACLEWIRHRGFDDVLLVPAGYGPRQEARREDDACAEAVDQLLRGLQPDVAELIASCWSAPVISRRLARTPALRADVELALTVDSLACVPLASRQPDHILVHRAPTRR